jgi:hypothetical protein
MLSRFLARLVLAAAFLLATQVVLQHPLEHLKQSSAPAQHQHCDACIAFASVGPAAVSHAPLCIAVAAVGFAATMQAPVFVAAFTPHFYSQAPPALV